jgi:hypothetical protein
MDTMWSGASFGLKEQNSLKHSGLKQQPFISLSFENCLVLCLTYLWLSDGLAGGWMASYANMMLGNLAD